MVGDVPITEPKRDLLLLLRSEVTVAGLHGVCRRSGLAEIAREAEGKNKTRSGLSGPGKKLVEQDSSRSESPGPA